MIMIAGRRKVQKDGHMQIVCHTSGNLRPMSWVGVHFIFHFHCIFLFLERHIPLILVARVMTNRTDQTSDKLVLPVSFAILKIFCAIFL